MTQSGTAQVVRGLPKFDDPNVIVGAEMFSDAGVYRLRNDLWIVQSVDFFPPLVDDPFVFGQIAAANSMSDIFAMGGRPVTALNVVGFPDDELELSILSEILRGGAERLQHFGATLLGGHSVRDAEIKYGLAVTGLLQPEELMTNRQAQVGDRLVLTKALGTGFVTTANKAARCEASLLATAVASMIQLNAAGRDAAVAVGARAATDVTGFGLAGHTTEMALASNVTIEIDLASLPVLPGVAGLLESGKNKTRASASNREFVAPHLKVDAAVDPKQLELLFEAETSGGLLVSLPEGQVDAMIDRAQQAGATCTTAIGRVVARQDAAVVVG
jgi:selenide,water dikinase